MTKNKPGWMVPAIVLFAFVAIVASCATLGVAPSEITGPKLFGFTGDWEKIPAKTITLFYPGQASWQYLTRLLIPALKP